MGVADKMRRTIRLSRFKPEVPKCWLFAASGAMWSGVGTIMCVTGAGWLRAQGPFEAASFALCGLFLAFVFTRFGFGAIAKKNIQRIRQLPVRGCLFAFQAWQSYLIILGMIGLGIALRSSPIPKRWLAIAYTGIGGALFLSSFYYYGHLIRLIRTGFRHRRAASRRR